MRKCEKKCEKCDAKGVRCDGLGQKCECEKLFALPSLIYSLRENVPGISFTERCQVISAHFQRALGILETHAGTKECGFSNILKQKYRLLRKKKHDEPSTQARFMHNCDHQDGAEAPHSSVLVARCMKKNKNKQKIVGRYAVQASRESQRWERYGKI